MSKSKFLFCIKALILLSPLPFGCSGRIWSPLFYLLVLIISGLALWQIRDRITILYEKKIRLLSLLFFGFLLFQLVPLPRFILKILSPSSLTILDNLVGEPFQFHSLSLVPADTLMFGMRLLAIVIFFYILIHLDLKKTDIYSLIQVLVVSACIQVFFGLIKWILKTENFFLFFHKMDKPSRLITGTFLHQDHFSFFLEMVFPLLIGVILIKIYIQEPWRSFSGNLWQIFSKKRELVFYFFAFALFGVGILRSKSLTGRMALFLTIVLLVAGFVVFRMKNTTISPQGMRWVVFIIIFFSLLYALQNNLARVNLPDREGNVRSQFWKDTGKIFFRFPIAGVGYGNFKNISYMCQTRRDETKLTHSYNEFLEHLAEGGIFGTGLFFSALGLLLFSLFKMWLSRHHIEVKMLGLAMMVGILAAVFHGLFDFGFRVPVNSFIFSLVLGLAVKIVLYKRGFSDEV